MSEIEIRNLTKTFDIKGRTVHALKNISLSIEQGDIFGIIGMSGAGKSTLVRSINYLEKPTEGQVLIDGVDLADLTEKQLRKKRSDIGMIFQNFNLLEQKNILDGVIDLHVHTAPDVIHRTYNDLELTDAAVRAGARAIVIKGHHCGTVSRAALCNAYNRAVHGDNSFYMYGGLVLNQEAGGLNEQAVQTALRMGAKIIWLPTVDAENEYRKRGKTGGIRMTDSRGNLLPELLSIFSLIKAYDAVLATGHISPEEIHCVVDGARNAGVRKIVITHPEYWVVDLSVSKQKALQEDYGVIFERCYRQPLQNGQWISNAERNLDAIRQLGTSHTILSTDCGDPANPPWEEAMRQYLQFMLDHGVSRGEIRAMTRTLPALLLGLEDVPKQ